MDTLKTLLPPLAAIVAAVIAATIAFLTSVFTKEAKVSEFRQTWIDAMRADLAELMAVYNYIATTLQFAGESKKKIDELEFLHKHKDEIMKLESLTGRIILRLDPKHYQAIITHLDNISTVEALEGATFEQRSANLTKLRDQGVDLLEKQWKRVKKGELVYRITKWVSLLLVVLAIAVFAKIASTYLSLAP